MIKREEYNRYTLDEFVGINTDSAKTDKTELYRAYNFNLTQRGLLEVRNGSDTKNESSPVTVTEDVGIISLEELWTRNLATGVKTRYLLGIAKTNLFSIQTDSDGLTVTGMTNIETGLTTDLVPDTEKFQNKMYYVNGEESFWTDGTNYYVIGIEAPTVDPTLNAQYTTGGYMEPGTYRFYYAYARSDSYGYYSEVGDYVEVVVPSGTSTNKVDIDCKATASGLDTSADKIYLFRTKVGDNASWYKVGEGTNTKDGATVTISSTVADDSIADSSIYSDDNLPPVDGVKYVQQGLSRMFYADDNYVYFSKPNLPECVPADNVIKVAEDDGQNITGLGVILNYLVVFKQTKTIIVDMAEPGTVDPVIISNNVGCLSHRTIQSVQNGQITIWLSQEGFMATDGAEVKSIVQDRIYYDISENMDFSSAESAFATYYKSRRQYICVVPYANGTSKTWVFSTDRGGFTEHAYPYTPTCFATFTNSSDQQRMVQGKSSSTSGYIVECDVEDNGDDGTDITWSMLTPFTDLGAPSMGKNIAMGLIKWITSEEVTATVVVGIDGVDTIDTVEITSGGSAGMDTAGDGFDIDGVGFDQSGREIEELFFKTDTASTVNIGVYGIGTAAVIIQTLQIMFYPEGQRGFSD